MKYVIEDGHLLDLISKVEKLVRLRDALPNGVFRKHAVNLKLNELDDKINVTRDAVEARWLQLENMDW